MSTSLLELVTSAGYARVAEPCGVDVLDWNESYPNDLRECVKTLSPEFANKLGKKLGSGSDHVVYELCGDERKVVSVTTRLGSCLRGKFFLEKARGLKTKPSPHIVRVYDCGIFGKLGDEHTIIYTIMEKLNPLDEYVQNVVDTVVDMLWERTYGKWSQHINQRANELITELSAEKQKSVRTFFRALRSSHFHCHDLWKNYMADDTGKLKVIDIDQLHRITR